VRHCFDIGEPINPLFKSDVRVEKPINPFVFLRKKVPPDENNNDIDNNETKKDFSQLNLSTSNLVLDEASLTWPSPINGTCPLERRCQNHQNQEMLKPFETLKQKEIAIDSEKNK